MKLTEEQLTNILNQHKEKQIPIFHHGTTSVKPVEEPKYVKVEKKPCYPSDLECDDCPDVNCELNPDYEGAQACYADCEQCPNETCPAKLESDFEDEDELDEDYFGEGYNNRRITTADKNDIKNQIQKSKRIVSELKDGKETDELTASPLPEEWLNFGIGNNLLDTELVRKWRRYKERIDKWIDTHKKFPRSIAKAILLDEYDEVRKEPEQKLPWNEKTFKSIVDKMFDTYQKKNADYGDSFSRLFDKYGMQSSLIRLSDKLNRLESLNEPGKDAKVNDESVEDTLLDLANYAILTIIELRARKKAGENNTAE